MSSPKSKARRAEFIQVATGVFLIVFSIRLALVLTVAPEIPFYDEWDSVIDGMARPMLAGHFSSWYLLAPHNEHTLFWTKGLSWLLLRAGDLQFDNVPVCEVSQFIYAAIAATLIALAAKNLTAMDGGLSRPSMASEALGLLPGANAGNVGSSFRLTAMDGGLSRPSMACAGRSRPSMACAALGLLPIALGLLPGGNAGNAGSGFRLTRLRWWFVASAGIAAVLPYGWENIGMGWGNPYYFLLGFGAGTILLASVMRGSAGALLLLGIVAMASGISMGSGFFADIAALLALALRVRIGSSSLRVAMQTGAVLFVAMALTATFVMRANRPPTDWGMLQSAELAVLILLMFPTWILLLRLWRGNGTNADVAFVCISVWGSMQICAILLGRPAFRLWHPISRYVDVLAAAGFANLGCLLRVAIAAPARRPWFWLARAAMLATIVATLAFAPYAWHWMNARADNEREQAGRLARYIHAGDIRAIEHAPAEALPYPDRDRLRRLIDAADVRLILGDQVGTRAAPSPFVENARSINATLARHGGWLLPLVLAAGLLTLVNPRWRTAPTA